MRSSTWYWHDTMNTQQILLVAILATSIAGTAALAQPYPSKPVKVIVPLTSGSPVDVTARLVGQHMAAVLGQPMIIENRPGAGATIGAKSVAASDADGYTLLHTAANHVIAPSVYKSLTYDPIKDFVGEMFKHMTQTDIAAIPYRGGAQAVTDILAGQIHMNSGTTATLVPLVRSGKLRAIAVIGEGRYPDLPEVPTMAESGVPLSLFFWTGMLAPAGVPADVIGKLNATLNDVLRNAELKESMAKLGLQPKGGSPQDFAAFLDAEKAAWANAVTTTGVKLD